MIRQIQATLLHSVCANRFWSLSQMKRKKKNSKRLRFPIQFKTRISSDHRQLSQKLVNHQHLVSQHWSPPTHSNSHSSKRQLQISMASSLRSKLGAQMICLSKVLIGHLPTVASTTIKVILLTHNSRTSRRPKLTRLVQNLSPTTLSQPTTCTCLSPMEHPRQGPSPLTLYNSSKNSHSHICLINNNPCLRIKCGHNFKLLKAWWLANSREQRAYRAWWTANSVWYRQESVAIEILSIWMSHMLLSSIPKMKLPKSWATEDDDWTLNYYTRNFFDKYKSI